MDAIGINIGYLLIQVFCIVVIPLLIIVGVVYWLIQRNSLKQNDFVATIAITDEGFVIPKKLLPDTKVIDVYQQKDKIILVRTSE